MITWTIAAAAFVTSADGAGAPMRCLREVAGDSAVLAGLDRMYRMDYLGADSAFTSGLPPGSQALAYFRGLNLLSRFDDHGDTASLFRAESLWSAAASEPFRNPSSRLPQETKPDPVNIALYRGLSTLQLSYVASLTGRDVRAAHLGRKAAGQLRAHAAYAEASAALALYDYYKAAMLKGVDWLPFVKSDPEGPLRRLEASARESRYLREVLRTSLLWLYYDAGRHADGMALIEAFRSRYPRNRAYRQIRADFLFRRAGPGDLDSARAIHEGLLQEYQALRAACPPPACLPLGYLGSVGNLVKVHARLGQPELRRKYAKIWYSSDFARYLSWMPGSLRREVDSQRN